MSRLIDITRPLSAATPPWPGDQPVDFQPAATIAAGDVVNLGRLHMSVHVGTHVDAPFHYDNNGPTIDRIPPETYVGPAQVIDVRGKPAITVDLLTALGVPQAPRLLVRTGAWNAPDQFPTTWPLMDLEVPAWLTAHGVQLIGLDAPSVDSLDSEDLPRHVACGRAGLLIMENLQLDETAPGCFELIALPLRLMGSDGSPVRAVLRSL